MDITAALLGALFNRYRGGIFKNRDTIVARIGNKHLRAAVKFLVQGDTVNAIAFATFIVIHHAASYIGMVEGMPHYTFAYSAFALWCVMIVMMFRGATPPWGEYIGAAGGWRPTLEKALQPEVHYIDKIIAPLKDDPVIWGIAGLSLRCGEWGLFIGLPLVGFVGFACFLPMLVGLMAGPLMFFIARSPAKKYAWKVFECAIGALLWAACV